jgi:uncharacterized OB-fold protein
MCPHCQSTEREWRAVSGMGTIWSYVVAHPPLLPAYAPFAPFPVITVTLDEDPQLRLVGNLVTGPGDHRHRGARPGGVQRASASRWLQRLLAVVGP